MVFFCIYNETEIMIYILPSSQIEKTVFPAHTLSLYSLYLHTYIKLFCLNINCSNLLPTHTFIHIIIFATITLLLFLFHSEALAASIEQCMICYITCFFYRDVVVVGDVVCIITIFVTYIF